MTDYFWCMMVYPLAIDSFNSTVFDEDDTQRYHLRGNSTKATEEWMEKIKNARLVECVFGYVWQSLDPCLWTRQCVSLLSDDKREASDFNLLKLVTKLLFLFLYWMNSYESLRSKLLSLRKQLMEITGKVILVKIEKYPAVEIQECINLLFNT